VSSRQQSTKRKRAIGAGLRLLRRTGAAFLRGGAIHGMLNDGPFDREKVPQAVNLDAGASDWPTGSRVDHVT
jgi:hypothetical protein